MDSIPVPIPRDDLDQAQHHAQAQGVSVDEYVRAAVAAANLQASRAAAAAVQRAADAGGFTAEWDADMEALHGLDTAERIARVDAHLAELGVAPDEESEAWGAEVLARLQRAEVEYDEARGRVYLTEAGRRTAAVVSVDEAELLDRLDDEHLARRAQEALAAQGDKPFITYEQLKREYAEEHGEDLV